jgi:hypothetical protein
MSKLDALLSQANEVAAITDDMNVAQKGGGGRLLPAGYAFGRLVEYVELGMQPQEYNGKAKDPALEVYIGFALTGEGYQNEDGTPHIIRPYSFSISRNEKAKAFKLFKALNWQGTAQHFAQLLGQAYLVKIVHVQAGADKKLVSRIDLDGFLPPIDPVTKQPYPIAAARDEDLKLFLWDKPTKEAWDDLYVEGTWDDGKSKNRTQETILAAMDYAGSPLEQLLGGTAIAPAAPVVPQATPTPVAVATPAVAPVMPAAAPAMPAMPAMPAVPAIPNAG